mmetsp:Transcript_26587/g.85268  ORF Transcript_26587/g.85268 Transcript_26587/m.85268 type:complete len:341 (-) Transcript_26587:249-1271(-)
MRSRGAGRACLQHLRICSVSARHVGLHARPGGGEVGGASSAASRRQPWRLAGWRALAQLQVAGRRLHISPELERIGRARLLPNLACAPERQRHRRYPRAPRQVVHSRDPPRHRRARRRVCSRALWLLVNGGERGASVSLSPRPRARLPRRRPRLGRRGKPERDARPACRAGLAERRAAERPSLPRLAAGGLGRGGLARGDRDCRREVCQPLVHHRRRAAERAATRRRPSARLLPARGGGGAAAHGRRRGCRHQPLPSAEHLHARLGELRLEPAREALSQRPLRFPRIHMLPLCRLDAALVLHGPAGRVVHRRHLPHLPANARGRVLQLRWRLVRARWTRL